MSALLACVWTLWAASASVWSAQIETLDRILAVVAGHVIMQSDVRAFRDLGLAAEDALTSDEAMLGYLIERRLILDEIDRYVAATPPAEVVEQRLQTVLLRFASDEEFRRVLARVGFTTDDLREVLRDDVRRETYLDNRFGVASRGGDRDEMVAEWVDRLVRRGQVIRTPRGQPPSG